MFDFLKRKDKKYICKNCGEINYESDLFTREKTGTYYGGCYYTKTQRMCPCGSRNVVLLKDFREEKAKKLIKKGKE